MKKTGWLVVTAALLINGSVAAAELHVGNAQRYHDGGYNNGGANDNSGYGRGGNADVVVDMPPEAWTQGQNNQPPCLRCCTYENRSYTEGSVVKMEGVLLQCQRDERSVGTNNLVWRTVR